MAIFDFFFTEFKIITNNGLNVGASVPNKHIPLCLENMICWMVALNLELDHVAMLMVHQLLGPMTRCL